MSDGSGDSLLRERVDSYLVPETLIKPRSFTGLMSVYESNFLRLHRLIPELMTISGECCSLVADDLPLHLSVIERTRYTCTMKLTYWFDRDGDSGRVADSVAAISDRSAWLADPDLCLRVYFDGQLAEVMSLTEEHRHAVLRRIAGCHREELDLRWRRNVMLNKWLEYCLDVGHCLR